MSEEAIGKARHRSPSYPATYLEHALELAQAFYRHARRTVVPSSHVAKYWDFSEASSGWRLMLAALKQFGLLESVGSKKSGEVKLTETAVKIFLDTRQTSPERDQLLKEVALAPQIYMEVWLHWRGVAPADDELRTFLTLHKGFNENAVAGFLADYKKTIAFARLGPTDIVRAAGGATAEESDEDENSDDRDEEETGQQQRRQQRRRAMEPGTKEDTYTLDEGQVVIQWPERIGTEEIEDVECWMQIVIRKMKRATEKKDDSGS